MNHLTNNNKASNLKICVFLSILLYALLLFFFIRSHSFFYGDDYFNFIHSNLPIYQMMFTEMANHFVPLYRLINALVLAFFPLNFDVALGLLILFHGLSVYLLYKLLQEFTDSPWNLLLVFLYASNFFLIHQVMWWSSGLLRLPYIFLSLSCLFCYVRYRKTRHLAYMLCSFAAFIMAFGFYPKAVLIPVYVLGLELCLSWRQGFRQLSRFGLGSVMLLISMGYLLLYLKFLYIKQIEQTSSLRVIVDIILMNFKVMASTFAFAPSYPPNFLIYMPVGLLVAGLMLFTFIKARETLLMWAVLFTLMILSFAVIACSTRGWFGVHSASIVRYYFDLIFLIVIYAALIARGVCGNATVQSTALHTRRYWVVFFLCLVYTIGSYGAGWKGFHKEYADSLLPNGKYMNALISDIDHLPKDSLLLFAEANLPAYVFGFNITLPMKDILTLRYKNISFVAHNQAAYEVDKDGHVLKIMKSD